IVQELVGLGFRLVATAGTRDALEANGIESEFVYKVTDGEKPHVVDLMEENRIDFVINTTAGKKSKRDSYSIRRTSLLRNIFYCTTLAAAQAATRAIRSMRKGKAAVRSLQEYHAGAPRVAEGVG
ncbi:MAG: carbamoyl phosphate synthase large subunit, partial [bacterium]